MWCNSAVSFSFGFLVAACRIRSAHARPALCPVRALASRISPWFQPFPPSAPPEPRSLCSPPSTVIWPDPTASTRSSSIQAISSLPRPRHDSRGGLKPSQVPCMDVRACLGSRTPQSPHALTKADARCCLQPLIRPRHSESSMFRRSIALPARTATDTSHGTSGRRRPRAADR